MRGSAHPQHQAFLTLGPPCEEAHTGAPCEEARMLGVGRNQKSL